MATSRMTDEIGRVLGAQYRLVAPIGSGASGHVYLADDVRRHRQVAVKVMRPDIARDPIFRKRFRREAELIAKLSHPNIVAIHDWSDDDDDELYLVLEYLAGGTLRGLLDTGYLLTLRQVQNIGIQAAGALAAAHARSYVHRDIKPANLLFADDATLRIADFGLAASLIDAALTEPGEGPIGTAKYAVPEQASGARLDTKADIYALGLVMIEAATGTVPLLGETMAGIIMCRGNQAVPVPEALGPLRSILEKMGQPNPNDRPSAAEVIRELSALAGPELDDETPLPLVGAIDLRSTNAREDHTVMVGSRLLDGSDVYDWSRDSGPNGNGRGSHPISPPVGSPGASKSRGLRLNGFSRRKKVLAAVLAVAAFAGGWFGWQVLQPPSAIVPNVDTMILADARARLIETQRVAGDGLSWKITVEKAFNETVQKGAVISQEPSAGKRLDDGGRITLIVSDGPPLVAVPLDLIGKVQQDVEAALVSVGLQLGAVTTAADETLPAGQLLTWRFGDQDRPPSLPKGTLVDLVLSSGPAPRVVPDLSGLTLEAATAELTKLGLGVTPVEEFHSTIKAGLVSGTKEPTGAEVPRDSNVTVIVSKGPDLVTVPSVKGLTLEEAYDRIEGAGLVVGETVGNGRGKPNSTDPDVGQQVPRGTKIDIFLKR